jgi:hypothetical protein
MLKMYLYLLNYMPSWNVMKYFLKYKDVVFYLLL